MKVKLKRLSQSATIPKYSRAGDCGLDFTATSKVETELYIEYGTSIAIKVPEGYVGLIYPRSSLSNYHLALSNSVGVIDQNFVGEVKFRFKKTLDQAHAKTYDIGDRIGQIIIQAIPEIEFEEVEELDETNRGEQGYGSSGK